MPSWFTTFMHRLDWEEVLRTLLILAAGWLVSRLAVLAANRVGRTWARRSRPELDDALVQAAGSSLGRLILVLSVFCAVNRYRFGLLRVVDGILFVVSVGLITHLGIRILDAVLRWYAESVGRKRGDQELSRQVIPLAEMVVRTLAVLTGLMVVLDYFHIEVRSILVTLGVGSLAIGLALQDTLANMFGGFVLLLDHPFRVGDRIQLDTGEIGDVQEIGLRSTRILKLDRNVTIVPNAVLCRTRMTNQSLPDPGSMLRLEIRLAHGTDVEQAKRILVEAAAGQPGIAKTPPARSIFQAIGEGSITLALLCRTADFHDQAGVLDMLNSRIYGSLGAAGIQLAPPVSAVVFPGPVAPTS